MDADQDPVAGGVPIFLRLAADSTRWQLLRRLADSDRRVRELCELVGQPQSAVSYHLARLRDGGLVSKHRSAADGRDSYYTLDLIRCRDLLLAAGGALHPTLALGRPVVETTPARSRQRVRPVRVLFLCTGNSGRSPIAAALLRQAGGPRVEVASAGSQPKPVHRAAVRVMRRYGVELSGHRGTPLSELADRHFDYVITLCDRVREVCPRFPGRPHPIHWSIPDPAAAGDARAVSRAFTQTALDLHTRIDALLARLLPAAA
jgi:protein-tyrosine-phosphatase/DNA-binding transcriptional ArsR family regulator